MRIEELRGMTDEELIRRHNEIEGDVDVIPKGMYLNELNRRDVMRQGERMEKLTKSINVLTLVVTFATLIGVCITGITAYNQIF